MFKTKKIDRVIFNILKLAPFFIILFYIILNYALNRHNDSVSLDVSSTIQSSITSICSLLQLPFFNEIYSTMSTICEVGTSNYLFMFIIYYFWYLIYVGAIQITYRVCELPFHLINNDLLDKFNKNDDE